MNWIIVVITEMHAVIIIQFIISQMVWVSYLFINMKRPIYTYTAATQASFWDRDTFLTLNTLYIIAFMHVFLLAYHMEFVNSFLFQC